jgi:peroxiredoxin
MDTLLIISSVLLWAAVFFNLLLTLALVRRMNRMFPDITFLEAGSQAPDFIAERPDGEKVTLATFARRKVALLFIGPACSSCIQKLPDWEALGPKARKKGVDLVLVSLADAAETQEFVQKYSIQLPILIMPRGNAAFVTNYKIAGTPQYCVVDEQGKVQSSAFIGKEWEQLTQEWSSNGF